MDKQTKVLFVTDDMRFPSGVGIQAYKLMRGLLKTGDYDICTLAGSLIPTSTEPSVFEGIRVYPVSNGYGDANIFKTILMKEKPDVIVFFSDPRFFTWAFTIDNEYRYASKIIFYHTWDNEPFPKFNQVWYSACDKIVLLSKFSYNLMHDNGVECECITHGGDPNEFFPVDEDKKVEFRKKMFQNLPFTPEIVFFYNNRNVHRKRTSDIILSFKRFQKNHTKSLLLMNTAAVDVDGNDLSMVIRQVEPSDEIIIINQSKVSSGDLNSMYNVADVTFNVACLPAEQLVVTSDGFKPIAEITKGMSVLTHTGEYERVINTFQRELANESLFTLFVSNSVPVTLTGEHPVYAIKKEDVNFPINENLERVLPLAQFISVKDLKIGDYVVYPSNRSFTTTENLNKVDVFSFVESKQFGIGRYKSLRYTYSADDTSIYLGSVKSGKKIANRWIIVNEDFAYMLGNWVADGSTHTVSCSFNKKDKYRAEILRDKYQRVFGDSYIKEGKKHLSVWSVGSTIYSAMLSQLCGEYSEGKKIPDIILNASRSIQQAFLDGYFAGDGCTIKNNDSLVYRVRTVSNKLIVGVRQLLIQFGYCPKLTLEDNSCGYGDNSIWCLEWKNRKRVNNGSCRSWNVGDAVVARIYDINEVKDQTCMVYNLEVEYDNSYVTASFAVHNCNEGFGLSCMESLLAGTPNIATKTGGLIEQMTDGVNTFGILLEAAVRTLFGIPGNPYIYQDWVSVDQIIGAMESAYTYLHTPAEGYANQLEKLGQLGREHIIKNYNIRSTIEKWDVLLKDVLASPSKFKRYDLQTL